MMSSKQERGGSMIYYHYLVSFLHCIRNIREHSWMTSCKQGVGPFGTQVHKAQGKGVRQRGEGGAEKYLTCVTSFMNDPGLSVWPLIFILGLSRYCCLSIFRKTISTCEALQPFRNTGNAARTRRESGRAWNQIRRWDLWVTRRKCRNSAPKLIPNHRPGFVFRSRNKRSHFLEPDQECSGVSRKIFGSNLKIRK